MPNKLPPIETRFKKGQSGNPAGGKLHNPELRKLKKMAATQVAEIGTLVLTKNYTKLKELLKDAKENPDSKRSGLKTWMATIALKGIAKGDAHALDVLLNRIVGKVKDKIEVTGEDGGPVRSLVGAMTKEERALELARLKRLRKEAEDD